ncbi:unnamed protein product, partial [Ixodes persulcatus]
MPHLKGSTKIPSCKQNLPSFGFGQLQCHYKTNRTGFEHTPSSIDLPLNYRSTEENAGNEVLLGNGEARGFRYALRQLEADKTVQVRPQSADPVEPKREAPRVPPRHSS